MYKLKVVMDYTFKAVIQNELNFSDATKQIQLRSCGYSDNDAGLEKYCKQGTFALMGALNVDFFQS